MIADKLAKSKAGPDPATPPSPRRPGPLASFPHATSASTDLSQGHAMTWGGRGSGSLSNNIRISRPSTSSRPDPERSMLREHASRKTHPSKPPGGRPTPTPPLAGPFLRHPSPSQSRGGRSAGGRARAPLRTRRRTFGIPHDASGAPTPGRPGHALHSSPTTWPTTPEQAAIAAHVVPTNSHAPSIWPRP